MSAMWTQLTHCCPPPIGPPRNSRMGVSIRGSTPSLPSTMPVRTVTTRQPHALGGDGGGLPVDGEAWRGSPCPARSPR